MKKIFLDTEFTGLHQKTTLISIGLVSECGKTFYAEFTDYDKSQVNDWIKENVISKLQMKLDDEDVPFGDLKEEPPQINIGKSFQTNDQQQHIGNKEYIKTKLSEWFAQFNEKVCIWSDCLAYDWVLFCELFGGAFGLPENIFYMPFDLATLFQLKGIDPDISREKYAYGTVVVEEMVKMKHTALYDAKVIMDCYYRIANGIGLNG